MAVTYQPWRSGSVLGLRQIHVASHVFFSQNGQDQWIYENILKRSTNGRGVFLEAGAVDGVTNSNTLFFERSLGWNGVCIEPSPESFKELQVLRPGCDTKNLAIGGLTKSGTASFVVGNFFAPGSVSGLTSGQDLEGILYAPSVASWIAATALMRSCARIVALSHLWRWQWFRLQSCYTSWG
mmetsp:Transcript_33749/g.52544  ORF Transcript_33749/g.52544 Transcript_33749/m.52544 type:complete len:182 (-) Transcript_33749:305-850(-)